MTTGEKLAKRCSLACITHLQTSPSVRRAIRLVAKLSAPATFSLEGSDHRLTALAGRCWLLGCSEGTCSVDRGTSYQVV